MTSIVTTPSAGTGLLAVFCDLDAQWVADFRPWLAEEMIPPRLAIGFGPAASFDVMPQTPTGAAAPQGIAPQAYLTAYVAPTLGDLYGAGYQSLRTVRGPRDAAYHQRMKNHARYTASWVGPGIEDGGDTYGPVIAVDRFDIDDAGIQAFNIWYETEYLPGCLNVPGLSRVRRYLTMEGAHKHLLIHEFASADGPGANEWTGLRAHDAWQRCVFAPGAPAAYRRVLGA